MPNELAECIAGLEWIVAQYVRGAHDPHRSASARASFARRAKQFQRCLNIVGREATIINGLIAKLATLKADKATLAEALTAAEARGKDAEDEAAEDAGAAELAPEQPSVSQ